MSKYTESLQARNSKEEKEMKELGFTNRELTNIDLVALNHIVERLEQFKKMVNENELRGQTLVIYNQPVTVLQVLNQLLSLGHRVLIDVNDLTAIDVDRHYDLQDQFWSIWSKSYNLFWSI